MFFVFILLIFLIGWRRKYNVVISLIYSFYSILFLLNFNDSFSSFFWGIFLNSNVILFSYNLMRRFSEFLLYENLTETTDSRILSKSFFFFFIFFLYLVFQVTSFLLSEKYVFIIHVIWKEKERKTPVHFVFDYTKRCA